MEIMINNNDNVDIIPDGQMTAHTSYLEEETARCWSGHWSTASPGGTCQARRRPLWVRWSPGTRGLDTRFLSQEYTWVMVLLMGHVWSHPAWT